MDFSQLAPAEKQAVAIYGPYYTAQNKRTVLPFAITLYKQGNLEGERRIEGGTNIPFIASWQQTSLPADITRCRIQFSHENEQLSYEAGVLNHEFIGYLIDLLINFKQSKTRNPEQPIVDFPPGFYRKLLQYEE